MWLHRQHTNLLKSGGYSGATTYLMTSVCASVLKWGAIAHLDPFCHPI